MYISFNRFVKNYDIPKFFSDYNIYIYNIPKSISMKRQQFNNAIRYLDKENREPLQPTLIHENFKIPLPDELTSILIKRNRRPS